MLRATLAFAVTMLLSGCGSITDGSMKTWMGANDTALLAAWGAPDIETKSSTGARIVTYRARATDGHIVCSKTFTLDRTGHVIGWSHNCPL